MLRSLALVGLLVISASAQESQLGRVEFPTSGSPQAQTHFLRGLAALHSFWYEEAVEAFRESTKARSRVHDGLLGRSDDAQSSALV